MSIDRLRYFAAVVETKNLRKAAELIGISPPSMSKAIALLEEELGHELLFADGRGIGITSKGLEVYKRSSALLEAHDRFFKSIRETIRPVDEKRIATFEVFSSYFIASFMAQEKNDNFLVLEMVPGEIEEAIISGLVDVGLTYLPAPHPALEFVEVGSFTMGIYGRALWEKVSFEEWPFAIPVTEFKIHALEADSLDIWPKEAPKRAIKYRFELLETALQAAARGLSVLHCPHFICNIHNELAKPSFHLTKLSTPKGYPKMKVQKVFLVRRKDANFTNLERKFAKFMRGLNIT